MSRVKQVRILSYTENKETSARNYIKTKEEILRETR